MKTLTMLASVMALLAAATVQADDTWRAATPRTATGTSATVAQLPLAGATGIVPADDAGQAPLVRTSRPAPANESSTAVTFTPVSANKVVIDSQTDFRELDPSDRMVNDPVAAEPVAAVPAALVNTPLVRKASYVRPISEAEMVASAQTFGGVQPVAQLEPVPTTTLSPTTVAPSAVVPATVAPSTSYYTGGTTVYQPITATANPCCDPCVNPCQTCVPTPVATYQPVAACPTGLCKQPTLRPGLWGQPSVHIEGQPIRNAFRWLVP